MRDQGIVRMEELRESVMKFPGWVRRGANKEDWRTGCRQ